MGVTYPVDRPAAWPGREGASTAEEIVKQTSRQYDADAWITLCSMVCSLYVQLPCIPTCKPGSKRSNKGYIVD